MIKAGTLAKGMFLLVKDEPYLIAEREFVNPGKGTAFVRLKLKNLKSGLVLKQVIKSQESVQDIEVETKNAQYLYSDADNYLFMDSETYEQFGIPISGNEDKQYFMKEGETYPISFWEEKALDIIIPLKIALAVTEAENALRGDTVSGVTKPVTLETGLIVKVPLFIKQGDKILINSETREYVERVN